MFDAKEDLMNSMLKLENEIFKAAQEIAFEACKDAEFCSECEAGGKEGKCALIEAEKTKKAYEKAMKSLGKEK